jgi:hypothetical protein
MTTLIYVMFVSIGLELAQLLPSKCNCRDFFAISEVGL